LFEPPWSEADDKILFSQPRHQLWQAAPHQSDLRPKRKGVNQMKKPTLASALFAFVLFVSGPAAFSQAAEIKLTFSEQFFDALLEAVFTNLDAPGVSLSSQTGSEEVRKENVNGPFTEVSYPGGQVCEEAIKLRKEVDGVRTAVRFRQGKIYAPIAFVGTYNPPLIGCIEFQGWAETNIDLAFNARKNALVGNAKVLSVNLSGTGGVGSTLIARMVQSSIDRKINPIEIISLEKLSFTVPIRESGDLRMSALNLRHQVNDRSLDVFIKYEFSKAR